MNTTQAQRFTNQMMEHAQKLCVEMQLRQDEIDVSVSCEVQTTLEKSFSTHFKGVTGTTVSDET